MSSRTLQSLKHLCDLSFAEQVAVIHDVRTARGKHVANYVANRVMARSFGDDKSLKAKRKIHVKRQAIRRAAQVNRQAQIALWGHA